MHAGGKSFNGRDKVILLSILHVRSVFSFSQLNLIAPYWALSQCSLNSGELIKQKQKHCAMADDARVRRSSRQPTSFRNPEKGRTRKCQYIMDYKV